MKEIRETRPVGSPWGLDLPSSALVDLAQNVKKKYFLDIKVLDDICRKSPCQSHEKLMNHNKVVLNDDMVESYVMTWGLTDWNYYGKLLLSRQIYGHTLHFTIKCLSEVINDCTVCAAHKIWDGLMLYYQVLKDWHDYLQRHPIHYSTITYPPQHPNQLTLCITRPRTDIFRTSISIFLCKELA